MHESKRVVVVTGGSRGIGRAICLRFAREGERIIFVHYDPDDVAAESALKSCEKLLEEVDDTEKKLYKAYELEA